MGLSGEHVQIMGHVTLEITCGKGVGAKAINSNYRITNALSMYNTILRRLTLNTLEVIVSTLYLVLNYPFLEGWVGTIREDQQIAWEYY